MDHELFNNYSFADAELVSYLFNADAENLKVEIKAWDGVIITVEFIETIGVLSYGAKKIGGFFEETESDVFFYDTIKQYYDPSVSKTVLDNHHYHCYKVIDLDDGLVLEVISRSVKIEKKM